MKTIATNVAPVHVSPALAAWESATMHNVSPRLTEAQCAQLWDAIVAYRATSELAAFEQVVAEMRLTVPPIVARALSIAFSNLIALSSAAAPAAKE